MDQSLVDAGLVGAVLLNGPAHARDTACTAAKRKVRKLEGLPPHCLETLDRQFERAMLRLPAKDSDFGRRIHLTGLSGRNETLFDRVIMFDPKRFIPIVYDPTIAEACPEFGHICRRTKGMHVPIDMRGRGAAQLAGARCARDQRQHGRTHPWPGRPRRHQKHLPGCGLHDAERAQRNALPDQATMTEHGGHAAAASICAFSRPEAGITDMIFASP